jgi:hypothetical protein
VSAPLFRICREVKTRAGIALRDVAHPLMPGTTGLSLYAVDAATALANARRIVNDARNLIAIPEAS